MHPQWTLAQRVLFRFFAIFFPVYLFLNFWRAPVVWLARQIFGITITVFPLGSGDTTFNYVQVFLFFAISVLGTVVWSLLDNRKEYRTLHDWLRVLLRYSLAMTMLSYGMGKVIQLQFPAPGVDRLMQTYGESSPMGLLWTFMGFSRWYNFFAGMAEVLGGLLLVPRCTTTLGALMVIGVMSNVVMLNFTYDVPVKLFSVHLLMMAIFLAAPDLRRLVDLLILNKPTEPVSLAPPPGPRWLMRVRLGAQILAVIAMIGGQVWGVTSGYGDRLPKERPALYGGYLVAEYLRDGQPDKGPDAWHRVAISNWGVRIWRNNGVALGFRGGADPKEKKLRLNDQQFTYTEPDASTVIVQEGYRVITLKRIPEASFVLPNRGFHWINEYPFNR